MKGLEFQLQILRPWACNPAFYGGRRGGLGRLPKLPLEGERIAEFQSRLQSIPEYYEQAAFRTVRALLDLYMHKGDWSLTDAMEYCVANAPHGELHEDSPHLWGEMQTTLVHVGWHMQMVVGKIHFMKLFRDRS
jgi:hypothetical protein